METLLKTPLLWIVITFGIYILITFIQSHIKNTKIKPFVNPLLLTIAIIILLLLIFDIPYEDYQMGGNYIGFFVTPATVALAIKLEKNFYYLKRFYKAILTGIFIGTLAHTIMIFIFAVIFNLDAAMIATLYPKSITTAIAVGVSESMGGIISLTVAIVVFTGVVGTVLGEPILKLFKIHDPVAQGVALGMSSHAMGTAKAIEMGEVQGAMAGLSIVVTGITVVVLAPFVGPIISIFG